ncbi:MAG: hypothetical protein FJ191_14395 [Gammaproteobacteria bacterium]|nr:hypothetical protein [Gammaproteobacteria bacterium]
MQRLRRPTLVLGLVSLLANTACYAYQPVVGMPRAGNGVRFQLTSAGTTDLAMHLGPNVLEITGRLQDVLPPGTLVVTPEWVKTSNGISQPWSGEGAVRIPREYVRNLDERIFSRRRSTISSVALIGGLVSVAAIALKTGGAHGNSAPGAGTPTR